MRLFSRSQAKSRLSTRRRKKLIHKIETLEQRQLLAGDTGLDDSQEVYGPLQAEHLLGHDGQTLASETLAFESYGTEMVPNGALLSLLDPPGAQTLSADVLSAESESVVASFSASDSLPPPAMGTQVSATTLKFDRDFKLNIDRVSVPLSGGIEITASRSVTLDFSKADTNLVFEINESTVVVNQSNGANVGTIHFPVARRLKAIAGGKQADRFNISSDRLFSNNDAKFDGNDGDNIVDMSALTNGLEFTMGRNGHLEVQLSGDRALDIRDVTLVRATQGDDVINVPRNRRFRGEIDAHTGADELRFSRWGTRDPLSFHFDTYTNAVTNADVSGVKVGEKGKAPFITAFGIASVTGGRGADAFSFLSAVPGVLPTDIDGGRGLDVIAFPNATSRILANLSSSGLTIAGTPYNSRTVSWGQSSITPTSVENLTGGTANDVLIGNAANNVLRGNGGADILVGNGGREDTYLFVDQWGTDQVLPNGGGRDRFQFESMLPSNVQLLVAGDQENQLGFRIEGDHNGQMQVVTGLDPDSGQSVPIEFSDFGSITEHIEFPSNFDTTLDFSGVGPLVDVNYDISPNRNGDNEVDIKLFDRQQLFNSLLTTTNIDHITGGQGDNFFHFIDGAEISGNLTGGAVDQNGNSMQPPGRVNRLNYSKFGEGVAVNLTGQDIAFTNEFEVGEDHQVDRISEEGVLPRSEVWTFVRNTLEGDFRDANNKKIFTYKDVVAENNSDKNKHVDAQKLKKWFESLLLRSDFAVDKAVDRTAGQEKTTWTVTFSNPGAILDSAGVRMFDNLPAALRNQFDDSSRTNDARVGRDETWAVHTEAARGDFGLDILLWQKAGADNQTLADVNRRTLADMTLTLEDIPYDASAITIKRLIETALKDRSEQFVRDGKPPLKWDAPPVVLVSGAGTREFAWHISFRNMGAVVVDPSENNLEPNGAVVVAAGFATGIDGNIRNVTGVTGTSSGEDLIYGSQVSGETILKFSTEERLGIYRGSIASADKTELRFQKQTQQPTIPDFRTGQPVVYHNSIGDSIPGLTPNSIYFVKYKSADRIQLFRSLEDIGTLSKAITLGNLSADSVHEFASVVDFDGDAKDDRLLAFVDPNALNVVDVTSQYATSLQGGDGRDYLLGGSGIDHVNGGEGDDTLYGDGSHFAPAIEEFDDDDNGLSNDLDQGVVPAGILLALENPANVNVNVRVLNAGTEWELQSGENAFTLELVGNRIRLLPEGQDEVFGGEGNDTLFGYRGADTLRGGPGDDTVVGGVGSDIVYGGAGDDIILVIEDGIPNDYDLVYGGEGNDTYEFDGTWGTASIIEDGGEGRDTIDLSDQEENFVHVLSNGGYFGTQGAIYNNQIRLPNTPAGAPQPLIKIDTNLEELNGTGTASPGEILTQWGFGLTQSAEGKAVNDPGAGDADADANAVLTAFGEFDKKSTLEPIDFVLSVNRGGGRVLRDISLPQIPDATIEVLRDTLRDSLGALDGVTVSITTTSLEVIPPRSVKKLRITVTPDKTVVGGQVEPASIELTAKAANTVVAPKIQVPNSIPIVGALVQNTKRPFQEVEEIKASAGANTFVFGNDYWSGGGGAKNIGAGVAQAAELLPVPFLSSVTGAFGRNIQDELTINTEKTSAADSSLVLDFRAVNYELRFSFSPVPGKPEKAKLTVRTVRDLRIPIMDVGSQIRNNTIVFTEVDRNTTIYAGRFNNTIDIGRGAEFFGHFISGQGAKAGGLFSFPGRSSDILLGVLDKVESIVLPRVLDGIELADTQDGEAFGLPFVGTARDLAQSLVFHVGNNIEYSDFSGNGSLSNLGSAALDVLKAPLKTTVINMENARKSVDSKSVASLAFQAANGNLLPAIERGLSKIDAFDARYNKITGLPGFSDGVNDISLGDVTVRSGLNFVRGTDYDLADAKKFTESACDLGEWIRHHQRGGQSLRDHTWDSRLGGRIRRGHLQI